MNIPKTCRLLVLTRRNPLTEQGGDVRRLWEYLRVATEQGFELEVVCVGPCDATFTMGRLLVHQVKTSLSSMLFRSGVAFLSGFPAQAKVFLGRGFSKKVNERLKAYPFDLGLCHTLRFAHLTETFDSFPWILELTDSISLNYSRSVEAALTPQYFLRCIDRRRLGKFEEKLVLSNKRICLISPIDAKALGNRDNLIVIPNSVDLAVVRNDWVREPVEKVLCLVGNFSSYPNSQSAFFCLAALEELEKQSGGPVSLSLIGSNLSEKLRHAAVLRPNVEIVERPRCIVSELRKRRGVGVCPIEAAAGIQNKILDYFCAGLPVVSSKRCMAPLTVSLGECDRVWTPETRKGSFVKACLEAFESHVSDAKAIKERLAPFCKPVVEAMISELLWRVRND